MGFSGMLCPKETVAGLRNPPHPADQAQMKTMLKRHCQLYGHYPRQASLDGGFATQGNLDWAKGQGIQDVAFAKNHKSGVRESF